MQSSTKIGLCIALLCGGVLLFSASVMARRVASYYETNPASQWHFEEQITRQFTAYDKAVTIEDIAVDPAKAAAGVDAQVRVTFGEQSTVLDVHKPVVPKFRDLTVYGEHMAILLYAPIEAGQLKMDAQGLAGARWIIVNRRSAAGFTPDTWGAVRVRDWVFDLVELQPDGTIARSVMQFPAKDRKTNELFVPAKREDPNSDVVMIPERSWQWGAALFAVPKSQVSRYRFRTDAVAGTDGSDGMGWTLPAAAFSCMGLLIGVGLIMSSSVKRAPQPTRT
jgi:hypothetical protein